MGGTTVHSTLSYPGTSGPKGVRNSEMSVTQNTLQYMYIYTLLIHHIETTHTLRGGNFLKFCRQEVASFWRQRIVCRQNNPDVIIT